MNQNKIDTTNILLIAIFIVVVIGLIIALWIAYQQEKAIEKMNSQILYKVASEYDPELANWIAEKVYLGEIRRKKGDEALRYLIKFYEIAEQ